jgi:hypothetical protein
MATMTIAQRRSAQPVPSGAGKGGGSPPELELLLGELELELDELELDELLELDDEELEEDEELDDDELLELDEELLEGHGVTTANCWTKPCEHPLSR